MYIIGIDIGSSTTKIIEYKDNIILNKSIENNENKTANDKLKEFIHKFKIDISKIDKIAATGIGVEQLNKNEFKIPVEIIDEFKAIGRGGLDLSKKKEALIVSIGTRNRFCKCR